MYYNINSQQLVSDLPAYGYTSEGVLVTDLQLAGPATLASCGFVPVVSDTPAQPIGAVEDVPARVVTVVNGEASVVRTWLILPPEVPASVSARQIRLWLVTNGVSMAQVDAAIASIPDAAVRETTKIEWEFAPYVERTHPMLASIATALGFDEEQIDQAFIEAVSL